MSDWTKFRDSVIKTLKFDTVTEEMKKDLTIYIKDVILPLAKESAESFISQTKEQAIKETGWV